MCRNIILTSQLAPPGCPTRQTCRIPTSRLQRRRYYCRISRPCAANQPFGVSTSSVAGARRNKDGSENVIENEAQVLIYQSQKDKHTDDRRAGV